MRLLAIAVGAILATASAEAACPPYHPACVTFGPNGFTRGTDRFGPYYGNFGNAQRNLHVERTAPAEAQPAAPRFSFDPFGRVIVAPPQRRPVAGAEAYPPEDTEAGVLPEGMAPPDATARFEATAPSGAAAPRVVGMPQGPADTPMQPSNGSYAGPRSPGRY